MPCSDLGETSLGHVSVTAPLDKSGPNRAQIRIRGQESWQNLDGYGAIEPRVSGTIHLAHAAGRL